MHTLTGADFRLPRRSKTSHKGQNGRVLIVGGSPRYVGALALAGLAAARSGADLVTVMAPEKIAWAINALTPDLITVKMRGAILTERHAKQIIALAANADVVLIGNGMGRDPRTAKLVSKLCALPNKKVVDADALHMVRAQELHGAILTPHKRELEAFLKNSGISKTDDVRHLHSRLKSVLQDNIVVVKGREDFVLGKMIVRNTTGNPGMTRGGTGDVLAGLCAGFYAQQDMWQAACNATYINGVIGDKLLRKKKGFTFLASDMIDEIRKIRDNRGA